MKKQHGMLHAIPLKKQFGQHFLQDQSVIDTMIAKVHLTQSSSIFEIGCGAGVLTKSILSEPISRLWVFEIDPDWADYVAKQYPDSRMKMHLANILDADFSPFVPFAPWTLLANLPYQVTFPILHMLVANRSLLKEGVVMVQEEVAQKIVKTGGRGYGYQSVYLQHFFDWQLLTKIPPTAFYPAPKVDSRLLYFKPKPQLDVIIDEPEFWQFIKRVFLQPRRTLKNNLQMFHYKLEKVPESTLSLRAQQMNKHQLIELWQLLNS